MCVSAGGGTGAWSVRILLVIDDLLVVFGGRRRLRMEHSQISCRNGRCSRVLFGGRRHWCVGRSLSTVPPNRQPSSGSRGVAAPARGGPSDFFLESTTVWRFSAGGGAGAWSIFRILFGMDDPPRLRVERPQNSVRNRPPSCGFRRVAAFLDDPHMVYPKVVRIYDFGDVIMVRGEP